jgi:preprotein translocase subunit SecG
MYSFILGLLILDSAILMVVVLLQAGQGGGLAALGGSGGTESFFGGRHAVTWLTKTTWVTGGAFLFLSLVLSFMSASSSIGTTEVQELLRAPAGPVQTAPLPLDTEPLAPEVPAPGEAGQPGGAAPDSGQ